MNEKPVSVNVFKETIQWIEAILLAVIIALLIRGFIFEPVLVQGESMQNTLTTGERLIIYKLGYHFAPPKQGDIIVLQVQEGALKVFPFIQKLPLFRKIVPNLDELDYIKRVVGIPGDKIKFVDGTVFVNGEKLKDTYSKGSTYGTDETIIVPKNKVFVLGDNRENSKDSREIGCVDYDKIKGKAVLRIWPFKVFGKLR